MRNYAVQGAFKKIIGWENKKTGGFLSGFKKFLSWDADIALRYYPVVKFIKKNNCGAILEVGCGSRGLAVYVNKKVTGLDLDYGGVKLENLEEVLGSSGNSPFKNNEFETVLCLDVLEHIREDQRLKTIEELFRVSSKFIILGAPEGDKARELDKIYDLKFKKHFNAEHKYVSEHIKRGLPEIGNYLEKIKNYNFKILKIADNAPSFLWKIINVNFMRRGLFLNLIFRLSLPFLSLIKGKHCYRKIYFIEKTS